MIHGQFNLNISAKDVYNDKDVSPLQTHAKPGKSEPTHVGCYNEWIF
jgi:hypothetical protein